MLWGGGGDEHSDSKVAKNALLGVLLHLKVRKNLAEQNYYFCVFVRDIKVIRVLFRRKSLIYAFL